MGAENRHEDSFAACTAQAFQSIDGKKPGFLLEGENRAFCAE